MSPLEILYFLECMSMRFKLNVAIVEGNLIVSLAYEIALE